MEASLYVNSDKVGLRLILPSSRVLLCESWHVKSLHITRRYSEARMNTSTLDLSTTVCGLRQGPHLCRKAGCMVARSMSLFVSALVSSA